MTTQPDHQAPATPRPATLHELRTALSRYGLPGDREQYLAAALDASPIGDLAAVTEVIATYRHREWMRGGAPIPGTPPRIRDCDSAAVTSPWSS
ncbi:hypothetical protein [Kitasatospora sp. NPDC001527]|uniref:hypothetical protein n=1 Tax=Kitasatospora sp. NPDC001527 TaxID=3154519 RepID=UPI0033338338